MRKTKYALGLSFLVTAATSLSGCGPKKGTVGEVSLWSSFGSGYSEVVQAVVDQINADKGYKIVHETHDSYDKIFQDMQSASSLGDYPNIAMGYPDHFATYMSSDILLPLDQYLTQDDIKDYYDQYMEENYFWADDGSGAKNIYGLPFNKSTELLGYNGTFVDYCKEVHGAQWGNLPATWGDWQTKGADYYSFFQEIMGKKVYGVQDVYGHSTGFVVLDPTDPAPSGKTLLLDLENVDPTTAYLMSWDATDNAFITLVRQWDAEYTVLPETEKAKAAKKRVGDVMFNSADNQGKVVDMLKMFNQMRKDHIFAIPKQLGGSYSSDAFKKCQVMFMVCSSGGLSYNTKLWSNRFSVAPIPYKDAAHKRVISQGADICLTDLSDDNEDSVNVIKALTTGKYQAQFCLQTGYYPCSKSAFNNEDYQAFLHEDERKPAAEAYSSPTRVAYREGSRVNSDYYMKESEGWLKFYDPAFKGSAILRQAVKGVFESVFKLDPATATDADYIAKLNEIETAPTIAGESTIHFVH